MTGALHNTDTGGVFHRLRGAAGDTVEDARLCADGVFPPGTFNGEIVVCERGVDMAAWPKGETVTDGGAGGYILAQPDEFGGGPGSRWPNDPHVFPALHIDYYEYQKLQAYMDSAPVVSGTITGSVKDVDPSTATSWPPSALAAPTRPFLMSSYPMSRLRARGIWAAYHQGDAGDGDYTYK